METDASASLRGLADHIDRHDLPAFRFSFDGPNYFGLHVDSQRAVSEWAASFGATVERAPILDPANTTPFVAYSFSVEAFGCRVHVMCADRDEAALLLACGCNWRSPCDRCAGLAGAA